MKKKKNISLFICSAIFVTLLSGCESKASVSSNVDDLMVGTPKSVTLDVGIWAADNDAPGQATWSAYRKKMKEKYPYITLKGDYYDYSPETFLPKAESGQLPTIYKAWFTESGKIIANGYSSDITEYMEKYNYDKSVDPNVAKIVMKDDKWYAVPIDGYSLGLYINMNLFKQAGLIDDMGLPKYPKTFEDLALTARTIKQKTGKAGMFIPTKDHVGGWHFTAIAWAFGAEFEKQENGKMVSGMNSPEAVAALQYVKELKWKYDVLLPSALLSWGDWIKNFATDEVGMVLGAPDALNNPVNDYKMSKDAIAMAPFPNGPKGQYSLTGGNAFFLAPNATKDQIDAAFKLFEVMGYSPKSDADTMAGTEQGLKDKVAKNVPAGLQGLPIYTNKDRVDAETTLNKKYMNVNYDLFKPYYEGAFKSIKAEEPYNAQDMYALFDTCIQNVITDKNSDPKALLDKASSDFQTKFLDKIKVK
ncbi:MAG: ABC transporter substrate-binding protein [Clostridiaceae bacterium]|nr:ABC transporter substrate-binding protein [Clostridiaceae bacterium]